MAGMPTFRGGRNIAMKLPPDRFDSVVAFYRDTLSMPVTEDESGSFTVDFGPMKLWLDRVPAVSQAELWLEIICDDTAAAAAHLGQMGVVRCDDIEALPEGFKGFWVKNPADIVHLVAETRED